MYQCSGSTRDHKDQFSPEFSHRHVPGSWTAATLGARRAQKGRRTMAIGTVKTIRDDKGFGFIGREGGSGRDDLFFHRSAVDNNGYDMLREGQRVSFDEEPDPRDPSRRRAVRVTPLDDDDQM